MTIDHDGARPSRCSITVSLPHPRPGRDGVVTVSLTETDDGVITLTCRDNGVGNSGRTDSAKPAEAKSLPSIGLRLMESAASQTGSSFEVHADENGYRIDVVSLSGQPQG